MSGSAARPHPGEPDAVAGEPSPRVSWTPSDMRMRLVSSLVGLPIVVSALWAGGPWFGALAAVGAALATHEYLRVVAPRPRALRWVAVATSAALPLLVTAHDDGVTAAFIALVLGSMAGWVVALHLHDNAAAEHVVGHLLASILLPSGGLAALALLRVGPDGLGWASLTVFATVANDSMALFVGRAIGRRPLLPRVSPHKTWEGVIGGAAGALIATLTIGLPLLDLKVVDVVAVTAIVSIAGPLGDLSKSMVKRTHGLDDFGRLLPGHGGVMDRIDALVFNAPLLFAWVSWLRAG